MPQQWTVSLLVCKKLYERHFKKAMPSNMPYVTAGNKVLEAVGPERFNAMIEEIIKEEK